jgi:hypothetical protein
MYALSIAGWRQDWCAGQDRPPPRTESTNWSGTKASRPGVRDGVVSVLWKIRTEDHPATLYHIERDNVETVRL